MPHDPAQHLRDVLAAADRVARFTHNRDYVGYCADELLQAAIERQFTIIGEALVRLRRDGPDHFARITDMAKIVAFRNILVHGYDAIDHDAVWDAVTNHLPVLVEDVTALLGSNDE